MIVIENELERCRPWLEAAIKTNNGQITWEQVEQGIREGSFLFVPNSQSAIVLEPFTQPSGKRVMNFFLAGGDLDQLRESEKIIAQKSKQLGFDGMSIVGRRGWLKVLDGYSVTMTIMEKEL